jgi:hypothetical protein
MSAALAHARALLGPIEAGGRDLGALAAAWLAGAEEEPPLGAGRRWLDGYPPMPPPVAGARAGSAAGVVAWALVQGLILQDAAGLRAGAGGASPAAAGRSRSPSAAAEVSCRPSRRRAARYAA